MEIQASDYVSYSLTNSELFAYFSFDPALPSQLSTQTAHDMLSYAYVSFNLMQPNDLGGSLQILEASTILQAADFERFEVRDGQLVWRLVRSSAEHYLKRLSIYDDDPTNDPPPGGSCVTGDIVGECACEFSGPAIAVTLDSATPL